MTPHGKIPNAELEKPRSTQVETKGNERTRAWGERKGTEKAKAGLLRHFYSFLRGPAVPWWGNWTFLFWLLINCFLLFCVFLFFLCPALATVVSLPELCIFLPYVRLLSFLFSLFYHWSPLFSCNYISITIVAVFWFPSTPFSSGMFLPSLTPLKCFRITDGSKTALDYCVHCKDEPGIA